MFQESLPRKRPQGRPRMHCSDYISQLVWELSGILPEEMVRAAGGKTSIWTSSLGPLTPVTWKKKKMLSRVRNICQIWIIWMIGRLHIFYILYLNRCHLLFYLKNTNTSNEPKKLAIPLCRITLVPQHFFFFFLPLFPSLFHSNLFLLWLIACVPTPVHTYSPWFLSCCPTFQSTCTQSLRFLCLINVCYIFLFLTCSCIYSGNLCQNWVLDYLKQIGLETLLPPFLFKNTQRCVFCLHTEGSSLWSMDQQNRWRFSFTSWPTHESRKSLRFTRLMTQNIFLLSCFLFWFFCFSILTE